MDIRFAATAFATAFTIIDPVGMIPLTLAVTSGTTPRSRAAIVDRAVIVGAVVILVMGLVGRPLLEYLGITLPAFTIAGGILLFLIAIDMLFARRPGTKQTDAEQKEATQIENPAVFPLAVPMIAGPGTIATVLLLIDLTHYQPAALAIVFFAFVAALLVTWLCMRGASLLLRFIGNTGVNVVTRLLGIILAALAVQFVLNGLAMSPLLHPASAAHGS
jgi:multiple antibiotic resistance protein